MNQKVKRIGTEVEGSGMGPEEVLEQIKKGKFPKARKIA